MRSRSLLHALGVVLFAAEVAAADGMAPGDVMSRFRQYESLNEAFVREADCPCRAEPLREEMERYAEGPLEEALDSAVQMICGGEGAAVLHALFQLTLAASATGSESPGRALGQAFACGPELVEREFRALEPSRQLSLFEMLGMGFENAVYDRPEAREVVELRARLQSLAPDGF